MVTRGEAGLTVYTRTGGEYSVPGEPVRVVDTIGAGDTVNAALLHTLAERDLLSADTWPQILGFAARAAAITCTCSGADRPSLAICRPQRPPSTSARHTEASPPSR